MVLEEVEEVLVIVEVQAELEARGVAIQTAAAEMPPFRKGQEATETRVSLAAVMVAEVDHTTTMMTIIRGATEAHPVAAAEAGVLRKALVLRMEGQVETELEAR